MIDSSWFRNIQILYGRHFSWWTMYSTKWVIIKTCVSERAIDKDCIHSSRGEEKTKSKAGMTLWSGAVILCHRFWEGLTSRRKNIWGYKVTIFLYNSTTAKTSSFAVPAKKGNIPQLLGDVHFIYKGEFLYFFCGRKQVHFWQRR